MACVGGGFFIDDQKMDRVFIDDQELDFLYIDDECVFSKEGQTPPGGIWFDVPGTYTWTTPAGYTQMNVCMVAGGGGGGNVPDLSPLDSNIYETGGGHAGEEFSGTVDVTPETEITIVVGRGGTGKTSNTTPSDGGKGEDSIFHTVTCVGGDGGKAHSPDYKGEGAEKTGCGGTRHDGSMSQKGTTRFAYGSEASSFAWGKNGAIDSDGADGGVGAGGACSISENQTYAGDGGRGEVRVSWGDTRIHPAPIRKLSELTEEELNELGIRRT